jgi:ferrochelatase
MVARYRAIGGSPLADITERQRAALSETIGLPVYVGTRFGSPTLREALDLAHDVRRLVVLPLAPFSAPPYFRAVVEARGNDGPELVRVAPWGNDPDFLGVHATQIRQALSRLGRSALVLSAHSLPLELIRKGDSYQVEVEQAARRLGEMLGLPYLLGYQSGGQSGEWLGPRLSEVLRRARADGQERVVVVPFGFVAEHVETLYDLDIEARGDAESLGLEFIRLPTPNAAPGFIRTLERLVSEALAQDSRSDGSIR